MDTNKRNILGRCALTLVFFGIFLFLPAGTLAYWQAWVYCLVLGASILATALYFLEKDPALLNRRSKMRETEPAQKIIMTLFYLAYMGLHVVAGLDHRFHWSQVPASLVLGCDLVIILSYGLITLVLKANSYAGTTITVEKDQKLVTTGPYGLVRHPLYAAALPMLLATPLALGSAWGLLLSLALLVLLVFRILNEERVLSEKLPGYREYCQKTRSRLIPFLW